MMVVTAYTTITIQFLGRQFVKLRMELYPNVQERIEAAMQDVLGLDDEQQTYEDVDIASDAFVMVQTDDDTVYIDIGFSDPPTKLPSSPADYDSDLESVITAVERAYLRVQNRKTTLDFEPVQQHRPVYRVTRPLVVDDEPREED